MRIAESTRGMRHLSFLTVLCDLALVSNLDEASHRHDLRFPCEFSLNRGLDHNDLYLHYSRLHILINVRLKLRDRNH